MKLVDLVCTKCNAALQVNPELTRCICQYCGNEMLIDDEIKKRQVEITNAFEFGYQQEMGRQKAIHDYQEQKNSQFRGLQKPSWEDQARVVAEKKAKENKKLEKAALVLAILGLIPMLSMFFVMQFCSFVACLQVFMERKLYDFNRTVVRITAVLIGIDTVIGVLMFRSML